MLVVVVVAVDAAVFAYVVACCSNCFVSSELLLMPALLFNAIFIANAI